MDADPAKVVLRLTGCIMAAFGLIVLVGVLAARRFFPKSRSPRALVTKYLAWFALIPPVLAPLILSGRLFAAVMLLASLQCIREFARATGLWTDRGILRLCYLLTLAMYVPVFAGWYGLHQAAPALAVGLLVLAPVARGRYEHMLQKVCLSVLAVVYFGWFLSHVAYLRNIPHGLTAVFFLVVLVECNDAFGYVWGKLLGRHKLAPLLSPNKTVEGAVGGAAMALVIAVGLRGLLPSFGIVSALLVGMLLAVLGTCGDLVVSFIKRDLAIKDMGGLIPGHGGLLDRCDSLVLTAPAFFHVMRCCYGS